MRILVACEFSGLVRDAFIQKGHEAVSCDLIESERPGPHYKGDVMDIIHNHWDMMVAFPPCTFICRAGFRWHYDTPRFHEALMFVLRLMNADIDKVAIENPPGAISTWITRPTQQIHPWQFGHGEKKPTDLWLWGLPDLKPTNIVEGRESRILNMSSKTVNRGMERSRTYPGIAQAMADQWG